MALYTGNGNIVKVYINGISYRLRIGEMSMTNGIKLLSSEDFILKDKNNVYLTVKVGDE